LVLILVGRAAFVFPLSALSNYIRKSSNTKIGIRQQVLTPPYMKYAVPLNIIWHKTVVSITILHLNLLSVTVGKFEKILVLWIKVCRQWRSKD